MRGFVGPMCLLFAMERGLEGALGKKVSEVLIRRFVCVYVRSRRFC